MNIKLILIILAEAYIIWSAKQPNSLKIVALQCIPNEKWIRNTTCFLKILSNRSVFLYGYIYVFRPMTTPVVGASLERWSNGYRPFLSTFWKRDCNIETHSRNGNLMAKMFLDMIKSVSNATHTCPIQGGVMISAVDPPLSMIPSLLVTGTYRLVLDFAEKTRENVVFSIKVKGVISSKLWE